MDLGIRKFFLSFRNAFQGLYFAFRKEQNFRIEIISAGLVLVFIFLLPLEKWEMVVLFLMIFLVLILEVLNTLLERLINIFKPRINPYAKVLKDLMAAAVFLAALAAAIIGGIIFWSYLF